ncbi:hypothetical protein N7509_000047 [Penicillium cosmopolitanum]|uniref:NADP-dependent oxidoreductase domain-containing protein n=1 Tax=Penicillium cosmopolitanum TaxID=1131564 RepID=A0A9X0BFB3_9EURO|nr:uncharacterized protein N7509_000047 [Penicillium cosmopolitanum]KAJ5414949.1 hypothetical protein N7509_000047 [Penicillium cosmopolitanum]
MKDSGGLTPGNSTEEKVITGAESLRKPPTYGQKENLEGINQLYWAGKFKSFGISNFPADKVETVIQLAKQKRFVYPESTKETTILSPGSRR